MQNFTSLDLPDSLLSSLKRLGFTTPTPIQAKAIPAALEGKDIIGSAQTGTGKTMAFLIPVIAQLLSSSNSKALIMTPTRELAAQVQKVMDELLVGMGKISSVLLIGGAPIFKQMQKLKSNPRMIVGTPGRITDHLIRKSLTLKNISFLVVDESDRMLDMGFSIQLDKIVEYLPKERQTLMFSATFSPEVLSLSKKYLSNPERISVGEVNKAAQHIKQETLHTNGTKKYEDLIAELDKRDGSILVFVNTKIGAAKLTEKLARNNHSVATLHGDIEHRKRERVIGEFRAGNFRIMVATDVASRGLDISHIKHVINYDIPRSHEDYIHRIGRTARAESTGTALNFILPEEIKKWKIIERLMNPGSNPVAEGKHMKKHYNPSKRKPGKKNYTFAKPSFPKAKRTSHA
ncbi:DEAD/DEAH box helicase [Candidatus Bandiella euplotis]|uniref:ATP-dependent RNA helicase RhlE n=1 Tax=Candidatus Bandiella euplotis TaxID=1664265 RepID=A0ABZ0UP32_9RICK|nr:DEAD/DEAH box helicase [Candidatus Bandiella woodruffii]WPX97021.1 ATP-dependent RNA helicase RhlE [Candidatus Bandiella woodruffii]